MTVMSMRRRRKRLRRRIQTTSRARRGKAEMRGRAGTDRSVDETNGFYFLTAFTM